MSSPYLPPFSGDVPHPPGYVCGALCTPKCVDGASSQAEAASEALSVPVPAPRDAQVTAPTA